MNLRSLCSTCYILDWHQAFYHGFMKCIFQWNFIWSEWHSYFSQCLSRLNVAFEILDITIYCILNIWIGVSLSWPWVWFSWIILVSCEDFFFFGYNSCLRKPTSISRTYDASLCLSVLLRFSVCFYVTYASYMLRFIVLGYQILDIFYQFCPFSLVQWFSLHVPKNKCLLWIRCFFPSCRLCF